MMRKISARAILSKIKGLYGRKETEEEKREKVLMRMLQVTNRAKHAGALLRLQDLIMTETALELDAKRKQDYIQ